MNSSVELWRVEDNFVELIAEQRSEEWHNARKFRLTASKYSAFLGLSDFETMLNAIGTVVGTVPEKKPNAAMQLGTKMESTVRDAHCNKYGAKCKEPSLCLGFRWYDFPCSWLNNKLLSEVYPSMLTDPEHPNFYIGGSPDGILTYPNGDTANMEIKFTKKMYDPLKRKAAGCFYSKYRFTDYNNEELAFAFKEKIPLTGMIKDYGVVDDYPHIYLSHFMQMTGCMAITNQKSCAYVVGSSEDNMYEEMVKFDENFWSLFLYPRLVEIVETELKPRMTTLQREEFKRSNQKIIDLVKASGKSIETVIAF